MEPLEHSTLSLPSVLSSVDQTLRLDQLQLLRLLRLNLPASQLHPSNPLRMHGETILRLHLLDYRSTRVVTSVSLQPQISYKPLRPLSPPLRRVILISIECNSSSRSTSPSNSFKPIETVSNEFKRSSGTPELMGGK